MKPLNRIHEIGHSIKDNNLISEFILREVITASGDRENTIIGVKFIFDIMSISCTQQGYEIIVKGLHSDNLRSRADSILMSRKLVSIFEADIHLSGFKCKVVEPVLVNQELNN